MNMDIPFINGGRLWAEPLESTRKQTLPQSTPRTTHKPTNKNHAQDTAPRKAHNHAEKRTCYYFFEKRKKYNVDNSITYKNSKQKTEKSCKDLLTTAKKVLLCFYQTKLLKTMSYTTDKKITQSAAMALLKTCRYGKIHMATIIDIANRATTYTIDSTRQRIGIHGTGFQAVLPIVSIHNTDYVDAKSTNGAQLTHAEANARIAQFKDSIDSNQPCQVVIRMSSGDYGHGEILLGYGN